MTENKDTKIDESINEDEIDATPTDPSEIGFEAARREADEAGFPAEESPTAEGSGPHAKQLGAPADESERFRVEQVDVERFSGFFNDATIGPSDDESKEGDSVGAPPAISVAPGPNNDILLPIEMARDNSGMFSLDILQANHTEAQRRVSEIAAEDVEEPVKTVSETFFPNVGDTKPAAANDEDSFSASERVTEPPDARKVHEMIPTLPPRSHYDPHTGIRTLANDPLEGPGESCFIPEEIYELSEAELTSDDPIVDEEIDITTIQAPPRDDMPAINIPPPASVPSAEAARYYPADVESSENNERPQGKSSMPITLTISGAIMVGAAVIAYQPWTPLFIESIANSNPSSDETMKASPAQSIETPEEVQNEVAEEVAETVSEASVLSDHVVERLGEIESLIKSIGGSKIAIRINGKLQEFDLKAIYTDIYAIWAALEADSASTEDEIENFRKVYDEGNKLVIQVEAAYENPHLYPYKVLR